MAEEEYKVQTFRFPIIIGLCTLINVPARAHMVDDMHSLGFPPGDYFEEHADADFIPSALSPEQEMRLRGVVSRLLVWEQGKALSVCFLSGSRKARARVAQASLKWTKWAGIKFDFGTADDPKMCDKSKKEKAADIKIGFASGLDGGYWSYLGTQSLKYAQSMNFEGFGKDDLPATVGPEKFKGVVLHEFGHALGLEHEHQSPKANCEKEFDWKAIYTWGQRVGWSKKTVDFNFRRLLATKTERRYSAYDPKSIMHYSLPVTFFKKGRASTCYVAENTDLSTMDKTFIAKVYPSKPEKRKDYTDFLMAQFRGILQEAGLSKEEIAQREKALPTQFDITTITAGGNVTQTGDITTEGDMSPAVTGTEGDVNINIGSPPKRGKDDENDKDDDQPKDRE